MTNIINETKQLIEKIVERYKPEKIILFGSVARGTGNVDSDIDLLIIKNSNKKRPFRIKEVFTAVRDIERNYPLDAIVYTPSEIDQRITLGDYFITTVLKEGKLMYGKS